MHSLKTTNVEYIAIWKLFYENFTWKLSQIICNWPLKSVSTCLLKQQQHAIINTFSTRWQSFCYIRCSISDFKFILFGLNISFCVWLILLYELPLLLWDLFAVPCRGEGLLEIPAISIFLVLQTLQFISVNGFFRVHFEQDQNSPLRNVISVVIDSDRNLDPQQASQVSERALFTKVHFLQVHFCSSDGLSPE